MNTSDPNRPRAKRVWFASDLMHVALEDGRVIHAKYNGFPRLASAKQAGLEHWELVGRGGGMRWPDLDEDLSTDALLRDAVEVTRAQTRAG